MSQKKPSCSDFIIAAIRSARPKTPGTISAINIARIFELTKEFYSEKLFRRSLSALINKKEILLLVDIGEYKEGACHRYDHCVKIYSIPLNVPFNKRAWATDMDNNSIPTPENDSKIDHKTICRTKLYVLADGLPSSIRKSIPDHGVTSTKAAEIMLSLKK